MVHWFGFILLTLYTNHKNITHELSTLLEIIAVGLNQSTRIDLALLKKFQAISSNFNVISIITVKLYKYCSMH